MGPVHSLDALNLAGLRRRDAGDAAGAARLFEEALRHDAAFEAARRNLGNLRFLAGELEAAAGVLEAAPGPLSAELRVCLARVRVAQGRPGEALGLLEGLSLGGSPEGLSVLGQARRVLGDPLGAAAAFAAVARLCPDQAGVGSTALMSLQSCPGITPEALLEAHRAWARRHLPDQQVQPPGARRLPRRGPLRLGFVSPDLRDHPVGWLVVGTLEALRRAGHEVVLASDTRREDALTARFRRLASVWIDARPLSDEGLAEALAARELHVLFDLAGHTRDGRPALFARRLAPVQATWLGYVGTTGVPGVDVLVADDVHAPPHLDACCTERILRLPGGYAAWTPPPAAPAVGPLPALRRGHLSFGVLANPSKVHPELLRRWLRVLRAVPESRLLLAYTGFDDPLHRRRLDLLCAELGVAPERVTLGGGLPHAAHLARYGEVDVALDTSPYSGGVTTLEALWMGVPTLTMPGRTFASRHAAAHQSRVGLQDWTVPDEAALMARARELSLRLRELARLRHTLRERVRRSPLCDTARLAQALVHGLRDLV